MNVEVTGKGQHRYIYIYMIDIVVRGLYVADGVGVSVMDKV